MNKKLRSSSGFTLVELMIGVVIVGLLASLAGPSFQRAWEKHKFKTGNQAAVNSMKAARSHSISTKQRHGVYFDSQAKTVTVFREIVNLGFYTFDDGDSVLSVDTLTTEFESISTGFSNNVILFNANGSASFEGAGTVLLVGYTEQTIAMFYTDILASTGRIRTQSSVY